MKLQHIFLTLIVSLVSFSIIAQNSNKYEVFLDENNEPINLQSYINKCKARVLYCFNKKVDSIEVNMVEQRYYFGKLDSIKHVQLLALLKTRNSVNTKPFETIIISHRNNLNGFEETKRVTLAKRKIVDTSFYYHPYTKEVYISRQERFDSNQKTCQKKLKRASIFPIYMYKKNIGYNYNPKHFKWTQSSINIPSIFGYSERVKDSASVIILRPNGNYFISRQVLPLTFIKDLLNQESWEKSREDLYNSIKLNSLDGVGLFKNIWKPMSLNQYKSILARNRASNRIRSSSYNRIYRHDSLQRIHIQGITTCFK